jgi:photosystem II stability/assembly factor-like uncharacterized protein
MRYRLASTLLAFITTATIALAAPRYDSALFSTMRWRNIGPYRGGRVTAVAGVPGEPLVYYQGATGGGVWKTEDGGNSWQNVSDGYFKTGSVGAVAVAPSDPNVVYVGMGEACIRSNFSHGDGVYKSTDAGRSWTHVGLSDSRQIGRIRVHPQNPDLLYVAAVGHASGANAERGLFRSKDGGKSWEKVLYKDDQTGAADVALDPRNPRIVYATLWQVKRTPWGIFSGGPHAGIYKSSDGGDTWVELTSGLPAGDKGRIGVAVSPVNPNRVFATVEAGKDNEEGGVFRSEDRGATWQRVNREMDVRRRPYYYAHIIADTRDLDTVYVLTKPILKSIDGGRTFAAMRVPHGDGHDLWIAPEDNRRLILGDDGGAAVSFDGGESWSDLLNQPTGQFYAVVTDGQFPYRVYGAQQDNTTISIASRTPGGGIDRTDWHPVGGGESGYIAPHPVDPNVVYAGSYWGLLTRYDHRTRETRNITPWPDTPMGRVGAELKYRFAWTFPILISPHDPGTIYAGANVLFRSTDEGQSWEAISGDLTRDDKSKERDDRLTDFYCTISTIAESRAQKGVLWVGSDDGLVHLTRDGGKSWHNVTPKEMPEWSRVNLVEASPHDAATAYLAVNRYLFDDYQPYLYKTSDYGKTWRKLVSGLPAGSFVRVVREDPERRGLLYAGTETAVHVSFDDGESWQPLQLNLPVVPITDLAVKDTDLVASTQGRAFWILDDLTPLRQISETVVSSAVHLFKPRPTYRFRSFGFRRGGSGVGQNPPAGAVFQYHLRDKAGEAALEILTAEGKPVRSFGAKDLPAEKGMNRFEWDLRYPDARGLAGRTYLMGGSLRGPVAVPGTYQARLRVGLETATQSFEIRKDPRLPTTAEELGKQFDLLIQLRDRLSQTHDAIQQVLGLQEQLKAVAQRARAVPEASVVAAEAGKLNEKLDGVLKELYEPRFTGIDDQLLLFPLKLNARLASLAGVVASADRAPTDAAQAVFRDLAALLDQQMEKLKEITEGDLAAFNRLALEKGVPAVAVGPAARPSSNE